MTNSNNSSDMYAVIENGGKQYNVRAGIILALEKIDASVGDVVDIGKAILLKKDNEISYNPDIKIKAEILEQKRDKKIIVYKMRRRKDWDKKQGHRQSITIVKILGF